MPRSFNPGLVKTYFISINQMKKGLVTRCNNIICCPLPSICTHILSQEATLQYNITLNVEHVG